MQIKVEDGGGAELAGAVQFFQRDDESVERAEALAVAGTGVVKPASDGGGDTVGEGGGGGGVHGSVGEPDGFVKAGDPGKFLGLGEGTGLSGFDGLDVVVRVDAEKIRAGDGLLTEQVDAFELRHAVGHELELFHRHGVFADGGGLGGMVEGLDHVWVGGIKGTGAGPSG